MTDQTEHCIYCGSDDLVLTGEQENSAPEQAFLYCRNCQAVFTGLEQRFNAYCTASPQKAAACAPEAVLKRALKLIKQSRCNAALELLSLPVCPLQRPLEFMIYRDVCQINGSLLHRSIVPHSDSYELSLLEMLDSNLRNMDYWLPAGDEDACLHILKNIHSALLHLNYASFDTIYYHGSRDDLIARNRNVFIKRAEILSGLAERLRGLQDSPYGLQYLKMAEQLLYQALGPHRSGRFNISFGRGNIVAIELSQELVRQINADIAANLKTIRLSDPHYSSESTNKFLALTRSPSFLLFLIFILSLLLYGFCIALVNIDGLILRDSTLSFLFYYLFAPICILCVAVPVSFIIWYAVIGFYETAVKRRRIYNRLYKNQSH